MKSIRFLKQLMATISLMLFFNFSQASDVLAFGNIDVQQPRSIKGQVLDNQNNSIPGATVKLKATTIGTLTDNNGMYTIDIGSSPNPTLVISFIGFKTIEVKVDRQPIINVVLEPDIVALEEVVVIGYGSVKKSDLTGSVATINADETFKSPVSRIDQALQGRAAGVFATSSNNAPGGGTTIRIRGGNSITAGNEPLYVIDGFIGADETSISPSDIESIEILKDASSTSIYGTRGANGVILITTKKGSVSKPQVKINSSQGWQKVAGKIDVRNVREFAEFYNNGSINTGVAPYYDLNKLPQGTDWQEVALREAYITDNSISVQGGTKQTKYYMSGNFFKQEGILLSNEFKRYNLSLNLEQKVSNFFKMDLSFRYSHRYTDNPKYSAGQLATLSPLLSVYDENGGYTYKYDSGFLFNNPIASANMNTDETINDRLMINGNAEFQIFKWLNFKSSLSTDLGFNKTQVYLPGSRSDRAAQDLGGYGSLDNNKQTTFLNENILSFNKQMKNSEFNAMMGFTTQSFKGESSFLSGEKILNDVTKFYALEFTDSEFRTISSDYNEWNILSFLGRLNYSISKKYLFTASYRRDGSSRLGKNNKWANFPSVAYAWKLSEEPFIKDIGIFSKLKLRTSYGITGNQGIPTFSTLSKLGTLQGIINNTLYTGVIQGSLENPNIKWETTGQFDLGLEAGFLNDRLSFEFDYYYKKTTDLLFDVEVPYFTGFQTQLQNIGSLQNLGYEALINAKIISKPNFTWEVVANISQYRNKILDLGKKEYIETYRLPAPSTALTGKIIKGQPLGIFVGYTFDKIDPVSGDMIFKDISGPGGVPDGVINELDAGIIGNANPKFFGGLQNNLKYKNFGLSLFFQGVYGNDLYNTKLFNSSSLESGGNVLNSYSKVTAAQWTKANPEGAQWPGAGVSTKILNSNSKFIQDGSYLRLKTLELSYVLPHIGDFECRIYFTGTNLFLVKNKEYLNYDPEVSQFGTDDTLRGYDNVVYPNNKSYMFGINISFK